jgi:cell division protein FtsQ
MRQLIDKKNRIIIYLLLLFILSTTSRKYEEIQNNYSSKINRINIEGLSKNDNSKIFNELNNLFYQNILLVHKDEIKTVISKYNIVEEYSIKKIYPSTININIKPTKFVARLSVNDHLVGGNGKLIEDKEYKEILPYIFGEFNSQYFLNFKENTEQSKFTFTKFKMLYFFPSNRWDILTNDDILIKLPKDNLLESLNLAFMIISNDDFKNKNIIDLRMKDHLIIK